jgi:BMFP domain-containing protein YqiC
VSTARDANFGYQKRLLAGVAAAPDIERLGERQRPRNGLRSVPMQSQNRFFDDLAKVAGGALGALSSLKQEMEAMVRERVERFMADNNMVPREEFDAVKAMASEARAEQERLAARVAALEAALAAKK